MESASTSRYIRENLINEVNVRALPMSGAYNVKDNKVYVHFCNLSHQPVQVERHQIMAVFDTLVQPPVDAFRPEGKVADTELDTVDASAATHKEEKPMNLEEIWEKMDIGPLNYEERAELKQIIKDNIEAFASSADDIGSFTAFPYELKYRKDAAPRKAYTKPYPSSMHSKKAIALWVERMYEAGVIERAPYWNEFQSACFVVPKKDGKGRMVVDMRKVNEHILEEDFAPAIPITHLMAEIQCAVSQLFSSIDIQHAFFSLHIMAGTEDATAFYADSGTSLSSWGENSSRRWVFKRCVMGAQPSSAALYKAMSFALQWISDVVIYCDDLFMHSVSKNQHFDAIRKVLGRLKKYRLNIAPKKCKFMHKNLTFLGYNISGEGIRPEKDKLMHLKTTNYPTNVKEIRRILGFVSFFHKFIPNSSFFSSQLTVLTRKNSAWKGGSYQNLQNWLLITLKISF